ncbi:hypothetical protein EV424DRAFT_678100 [Suillus variegatus]|nr:hypothetical protein EV424DRAFT_678100 [Suillus variegatus]
MVINTGAQLFHISFWFSCTLVSFLPLCLSTERGNKLSRPDDEHLIWYGDLRWRHSDERESSCEKFDWLVHYMEGDTNTDDETEGDVSRLQLSALDDSVPREFADLAAKVHRALVNLQQKHAFHVNAGIA